ncbi:MAG: molybdopterin-binding protein [Saccharolobus sp.]
MRIIVRDENSYPIEDALSIYLSKLKYSPRVIGISVNNAYGYILSEDVKSQIDYPPFSRSNVDGYAVKSSCTPGIFQVVDKISIGEYKEINLKECVAVEVDTGAPIPMGADAVIKVEDVEVLNDRKIRVTKKVNFGYNIGWLGSDIPKGMLVLRKGERITHEKISLLSSLGVNKIKVYDKLKVYVIATGDELVEPGNPLPPGKIYESNLHYLVSRLKQNYDIVGFSLLGDDFVKIKDEIKKAISISDVVILTGGTSAGEKDYVNKAIRELGEIVIHGIKIKPGKPTILGIINNKPVIGLSGNVVATIVIFDIVVSKVLESLIPTREDNLEFKTIRAKLVLPVRADKYRDTLIPVYLFKGNNDSNYYALPLKFESYMIGTFTLADGLIMVKAGQEISEHGEVEVLVRKYSNSLTIIGEEDKRFLELDARSILLGSLPALKALEYKFGDVLIISSLYTNSIDNYDKVISRKVLVNGEGEEIGYDDWIGISNLVKNPAVRLKSPSSSYALLGKAKVYAPEGYIDGRKVSDENLYLIGLTDRGKKFIMNLNI